MNKAYDMSTGDIIAMCNDKLCTPDAVTKLVRAIEQGGADCTGVHAIWSMWMVSVLSEHGIWVKATSLKAGCPVIRRCF